LHKGRHKGLRENVSNRWHEQDNAVSVYVKHPAGSDVNLFFDDIFNAMSQGHIFSHSHSRFQ